MSVLSIRFNDDDIRLIKEYTAANGLNISAFIRDSVMDTIEDSLKLDEKRILSAWERSKHERRYTHGELIRELDDNYSKNQISTI